MKNKVNLLVILCLDIIFSFFVIKLSSNILFLLFAPFIGFGILYNLNKLVVKRVKTVSDILVEDFLIYYLINLFLLIVVWKYFGFGFLKTKILILFLISIFSFFKERIKNINNLIPYFFLLNIVLLFGLASPMSPIGNKYSGTDSSVFRYIGTIMLEGKVPYLDVFDHKGIFLYFINYLGVLLDKNIGIWLIEVVFLFISSIFAYKLARLFANKFCSLIAVFLSFIPLFYTFEGGNLVEEYAICFLIISLYLFIKEMKKDSYIRLKSALLIGGCFGAVLLLRPNMIAVFICISIYILVDCLRSQKYKYLFQIIGMFLLGTIIFVTPFLIYLIYNGAIEDFIYQYFVINFSYSTNDNGNTLYDTFLVFLDGCKYIYLVIVIYLLGIKKYNKDKWLMILNILIVIFSFILVIMPKNFYLHYGMVMIPTFVVAFAMFIDSIYYDGLNFIKDNNIKMIFIILLVFSFVYKDLLVFNTLINKAIKVDNSFDGVVEVIQNNSNKSDNVLVYGNKVLMYLKSNRRTFSKYPYQTIIEVSDELRKDFYDNFDDDVPLLIVTNNTYNGRLLEFFKIIDYKYKKVYDDDYGYIVYKLRNK